MTTITPPRLVPEILIDAPRNAEAPRAALGAAVTPTEAFYIRNHFQQPHLDPASWRLTVTGAVDTPGQIGYRQLLAMLRTELEVVLECAGNGRTLITPRPQGVPWTDRAVSCGRFVGVPLREVLRRFGVRPQVCELLFGGADEGEHGGRHLRFERSLPLEVAMAPTTLLATHQDGRALTPEHGAPVRLVVPGWYGVANVKWLIQVRALTRPFAGPFQTEQYVLATAPGAPTTPVTTMPVHSIIVAPEPGNVVEVGSSVLIHGQAWSGTAAVDRVDISTDGGRHWRPAALRPPMGRHGFTGWWLRWSPTRPGRYLLCARARDRGGAVQPMHPSPNSLGYGNNAVANAEIEVLA